jgi:GNAT superfamily N-acetyltransferase
MERRELQTLDDVEVHEITGTYHVHATFRLRFEVWNAETPLRAHIRQIGLITDEHDVHARHWAAFIDSRMVAAARMCIHGTQVDTPDGPAFDGMSLPPPVATLNRLIVHSSARGRGVASTLDETRIAAARAGGANCVVGTFPPSRIATLERNGFRSLGQPWIPHYAESFVSQAMVMIFPNA